MHDGRKVVYDMCTSNGLLVLTRYSDGVFGYTLPEGRKWRVSGKLPSMQYDIDARGVTADEQGHLFVCDTNNRCVHLLSTRDGSYLGVAQTEGDLDGGTPCNVSWHQDSASLVISHEKNRVWHLSVFSRQV